MARIQVMSEILASQVAAGEVVERPASVVKELVENCLDAGAGRIDVVIQRGGVTLIRVTDDGHGMDREDAERCLERHATSKLRTSADLGAIRTLGFRGEAMPSIASVSKFTLSTREAESIAGTRIQVEGGKVVTIEECGGAPGTTIEVRNLFFNIPARRKFLRTESTEFSHIEQHLRVQALAHPGVSFTLTHDERLVFQLPGGGTLLERIRGLAGADLAERLLEVPEQSRGGITVHGYLGEAGVARSQRSLYLVFLNGRPVESGIFTQALRAAYNESLPRGQHPVTFLFVDMDPREVDVNVHPAKKEVRFRDGIGLQANLTAILSEVIRRGRRPVESYPSPVPANFTDSSEAVPLPQPQPKWVAPAHQPDLIPRAEQVALRHDWSEMSSTPAAKPTATVSARVERNAPAPALRPDALPSPAPAPVMQQAEQHKEPQHSYRQIGLLADEYLLMESEEGLVLMDFRAAWERVLFEEASARAASETTVSQGLLVPYTLHLSPKESDFVRGQLDVLRKLGVGIEEFGHHTFKVDALPAAFGNSADPEVIVTDLLHDLKQAGERAALRRLDVEAIAASISRQAARLRPSGTSEEMAGLLHRLLACEMPYCCPAGKPTLVQISRQELARKFGKR
jgi:DNA mismatch repair protein MutL